MLSKKEFTNGADSGTVINLYRNTATALLGSTKELRYDKLKWSEAQFERLGEALCYCGALETLEVKNMEGLSDTAAAAAVVAGLASCTSLKTLKLESCHSLTALPDLSALTSLQELHLEGCYSLTALSGLSALTSLQWLNLYNCSSLTVLPDLSAFTSLPTLNLEYCKSARALTALPDLSSLAGLKVNGLPQHLTPWKAGGFKAWDFITDGWPLDSTVINLLGYRGATLPEWLSRCTSVQTLNLGGCESLTALPDLSALTSLQELNLETYKSYAATPNHGAVRPVGAHVAAVAQPRRLLLPHGAVRPVGAHIAAGIQTSPITWRSQLSRCCFRGVHRFQPGARVRIKGIQNNKFAHLNGRGATVARVVDPVQLKYGVTLDEAMDNGQRDVKVGKGNLEPEAA